MTAAYGRVRTPVHRTAHLAVPGCSAALCGAVSLGDGTWHDAGDLPDCRACAGARRIAVAVAAWDGPPPRPGILAMVPRSDGCLSPVGECAACGRVQVLRQRGLCKTCARTATLDGTIRDYGQTREERLAEYAGYRRGGLSIREASERLGVSGRTGERYEASLAAAGRAPWRRGTPYARHAQQETRRAS